VRWILVAWIVGSALIGYWCRRERAGFWGAFLFALLFSPVIAGLALLIARPPRPPGERAGLERISRLKTVRAVDARVSRLTISRLITAWLVVIMLFGGIYWLQRQYIGRAANLPDAIQLSFEVATLGANRSLAEGVPTSLLGLERLLVLLIVALLISRTMAASLDRRRAAAGALRGTLGADLDALEAIVARQSREIAALAATMDVETAAAVTPGLRPH